MTTVSVSPTASNPTHEVSIGPADGTGTTYGLRPCDHKGIPNKRGLNRNPTTQHAFKTYGGAMKWADVQPPYSAVSQDDWSGGLGVGEFETNTSGYKIAHGINTMSPNKAFLGPFQNVTTGYTGMDCYFMSTTFCQAGLGSNASKYIAKSFVASSSYTATKVYLRVASVGSPATTLTAGIWTNVTGAPGALIGSAGTGNPTNTNILGEWWEFTVSSALTSGATYWVVVYDVGGTATSSWLIGCSAPTGGKASNNGTVWGAGYAPFFVVMSATKDFTPKFAEYKGSMYACLSYDDGTAPTLWLNGYQGYATSGSTTVLTDTNAAFPVDGLIGGVLKLVSGTGSNVRVNYRTITDNDATTITVSPAFDIAPASATLYAVTGLDTWQTVTVDSGYLPQKVTDMKAYNGALYFCMGTATATDSLIRYKNGSSPYQMMGGWNHENATSYFNYLVQCTGTDGISYLWGADNTTVRKAAAVDFSATAGVPTDIGWSATKVQVGDYLTKIIGLEAYGSPETPWALKEDAIYQIDSDKPIKLPLGEMVSVKSEDNGYAHCTQGVYLYTSLLKSIERYYNNNLDDININRDVGLPVNQRGVVSAMVSYPGKIYFSIDAGATGYSGVYVWDGVGFHEYYRGEYGKRIKSLGMQTIPGSKVDRLWVGEGNKIKWLPIALIPFDDPTYPTEFEGFLETSWIYAGMQNVYKTYKSLSLFFDLGTVSEYYIVAYYMKDGDSSWTQIGSFETDPTETVNFPAPISAKRIKLGFWFVRCSSSGGSIGTTTYYTPFLRAWVLTGTISLPVKWAYTLKYKATDDAVNWEGDDDAYTRAETLINQLDTWAAAGTPLTLHTVWSSMDSKTVIVDPQSITPLSAVPDDQTESSVAQVTFLEV